MGRCDPMVDVLALDSIVLSMNAPTVNIYVKILLKIKKNTGLLIMSMLKTIWWCKFHLQRPIV